MDCMGWFGNGGLGLICVLRGSSTGSGGISCTARRKMSWIDSGPVGELRRTSRTILMDCLVGGAVPHNRMLDRDLEAQVESSRRKVERYVTKCTCNLVTSQYVVWPSLRNPRFIPPVYTDASPRMEGFSVHL